MKKIRKLLLMFAVNLMAATTTHADEFVAYYVDVDGDGFKDVFFDANPRFILIASEIIIPIEIPADDFYFKAGSASGNFSNAVIFNGTKPDPDGLPTFNMLDLEVDGNGSTSEYLVQAPSAGVDSLIVARTGDQHPTILQTLTASSIGDNLLHKGSVSLTTGDRTNDGRDELILNYGGVQPVIAIATSSGQFISSNLAGEVPNFKIVFFKPNVYTLENSGQAVQLSWETSGATAVAIINDNNLPVLTDLPLTGSVTVNPTANTTFEIKVSSEEAWLMASITIEVVVQQAPIMQPVSIANANKPSLDTDVTLGDARDTFRGSWNEKFYKFDQAGNEVWHLDDVGVVMNKAVVTDSSVIFGVSSTPTLAGKVCAFDLNGLEIWSVETSSSVIASPMLTHGKTHVAVVTYGGEIMLLDVNDGSELWHYSLPEGELVTAQPKQALLDGATALYIRTTSNKLYAIRMDLASLDMPPMMWSAGAVQ